MASNNILSTDWFVMDARSEGSVPQGPYNTEKDARLAADQMCQFFHQHSSLGQILPTAKANGPFFAIPARMLKPFQRKEINRLMEA